MFFQGPHTDFFLSETGGNMKKAAFFLAVLLALTITAPIAFAHSVAAKKTGQVSIHEMASVLDINGQALALNPADVTISPHAAIVITESAALFRNLATATNERAVALAVTIEAQSANLENATTMAAPFRNKVLALRIYEFQSLATNNLSALTPGNHKDFGNDYRLPFAHDSDNNFSSEHCKKGARAGSATG